MAEKPSYYISHSKATESTGDMGWHIVEGGRSCVPPKPVQHVIENIPYRSGDIDIDNLKGLEPTYPMRELSYTLSQMFHTEDDAREATDKLVAWFGSCRAAELFDSCGSCTFVNVTRTEIDFVTDKPTEKSVTVTFKANPYRKDGSL